MTIRVAAIEVSHWHALNDAAYLRHLVAMPDVELVAIQDSDASLVAKRAAEVGNPPTYTDYRKMLELTRPDFVVALGRHQPDGRDRPRPARCRLSVPDGKADGDQRGGSGASRRESGETKSVRRRPLGATLRRLRQARPRTSRRKALRPAVAYLRADQSPGSATLSGMGLRLDARSRRSRRRRSAQSRPARLGHVPAPDRRGGAGDWRATEPAGSRMSRRGLRLGHAALGERHSRHRRGRQLLSPRRHRWRVEDRRPRRHPHHEGRTW